jgi:dipeptidyl aminopeptidase/acylaminoacyl peptidase
VTVICIGLGGFAGNMARAQQPFTLKQVLSAPYATSLTAAPVGARFAWVEDAEGVHNLWVGGANEPARQLTHYMDDDAQDISSLVWTPDGQAIAYIYGASNGASGRPANPAHLQRSTALRLIVQPLDAAAKPFDIPNARAPLFLPDGRGVLFLREGKVWAAELGAAGISGEHQLVYDRGSAGSLTLSPDGKLLAFVSSRRSSEQSRSFLGLYDFAAKSLRFVAPSTERDFAPAFSPDGKQLAWLRGPITEPAEFVNERVSGNPWSIQMADVGTLAARTVFMPEANKPGSVLPHLATGGANVRWVADGKLIFFSEADGWVHLYSLDPADGKIPTLLTPGKGEVEDVSLSPDSSRVFWASNTAETLMAYGGLSSCLGPIMGLEMADTERRHIFSLDLTKPAPLKTDVLASDFQKLTNGEGIETHPVALSDGSVVALASDAFVPMHPVYVKKDGVLTSVLPSWLPKSYPEKHQFVFPEDVSFLFNDRLQRVGVNAGHARPAKLPRVHGQLFLPGATPVDEAKKFEPACNGHRNTPPEKNPKKRPAIIFVHGGPRRQMLLGYPAMDYYSNGYAMNQYLTSRGFVVLSVNYRSGIGYGLDFRQSERQGAAGAAEYNDVLAAVRYLRGRADVDASRIGIWGGSYGGYLTALALARNSDMFAAGVDFHGVHEWSLEDNAPSDWLRGPIGERPKIEALAHASSPMADIDKWRSPVLLIHGDDDPEVAYAQTPLLADALRARKVPVEEMVFPDEVHGFLLHKDWLAAYEAEAAFFERVLKP